MQNLDSWINYVAYAGGFATGNFIGMLIEERIAIGYEIIRVITKKEAFELIDVLRDKGFGITSVNARGVKGEVSVIYLITSRKKTIEALKIIKEYNPQAFFTIEEVRSVNKRVFHGNTESRANLLRT